MWLYFCYICGFLIFSHIWWYHLHIALYQHHMWLYFCHIRWFLYFFFLTFDGIILPLCSTIITCDCTVVTFNDSLIFFSYFMVPSSHCAIPTLHVIVLLSHSIVPFFFLTFNGSITTLSSTNIKYDSIFATFSCTHIFFSNIWWYYLQIVQYQNYMWLYFCHVW